MNVIAPGSAREPPPVREVDVADVRYPSSYWVRRFIRFHERRHPKDMGDADVSAFLSALVVDGELPRRRRIRRWRR